MKKTQWIGGEGDSWGRLCLVFERMGYTAPESFNDDGDGNYVVNIANQYQADLTSEQMDDILRFAQRSRRDIIEILDGLTPDQAETYVLGF